ncbi:MAG TPA: adenosine kinase [Alphaproteobacteria bacterium]|nr:adenosine kinase [Alphaproteobacteria bacterium]
MSSSGFDVCAIGNALVDIIAEASEDFLAAHKIARGAMTLIDAERAAYLYDMIGPAVETSGGSAANTVAGIASLGGHPAYMGKVKADQLGAIFRHDMHAMGVHFATPPAPDRRQEIHEVKADRRGGAPTGRCLILVTPDAQRSMNTYLGAAVEFGPADLQPDVIQDAQVTYLEGYLFDRDEAKEAFRAAAKIARAAGRQMALTLSDVFCVERHGAEFRALIKDDVDILFANQNELLALYETQDLQQAVAEARKHCKIAVTTRSEKGAIIASGKDTIEIAAEPVARVVDTTGAGDLFAAGFLFNLTRGRDLDACARLGAVCAAEIIGHYGPRPQRSLKELAREKAA